MADEKIFNRVIDLLALAGVSELAVASTGTAYSSSFILPRNCVFGLEYKAASGGAVDIKIELEQGNEAVTTEGSADSDWGVGYVINSGVTDTNTGFKSVAPVVSQRARLKFTGQGSNAASSKFTKLRLCISENA